MQSSKFWTTCRSLNLGGSTRGSTGREKPCSMYTMSTESGRRMSAQPCTFRRVYAERHDAGDAPGRNRTKPDNARLWHFRLPAQCVQASAPRFELGRAIRLASAESRRIPMDNGIVDDSRSANRPLNLHGGFGPDPVQTSQRTRQREADDEGVRGDGPGRVNGRDDAGGAARAAGRDKRCRRSDSCVGIRPD
jgi:hypothetical protein